MDLGFSITLLAPLLRGLNVTIQLAITVLVVGTVGGVIGGVLSSWGGRVVRSVFILFIFLSRGIPLLVQVFAVFFILPLMGVTFSAFVSATLALSIFAVATITEIVRGGIEAVPNGQVDSARALGFSMTQSMLTIILPQAMVSILPPLISQFVFLVKATSIISLVGVPELMYTGRQVIERTLLGFQVMALIWLFYTMVCYPLTALGRRLEADLKRRGFQSAVA
jgi:His/Glu/Gln/Arg/opine family amino acid ABC transporter permease subunit